MKGHLNNLPESQNNFSTDARKLILLARQYYELGLAPIPCAPRSKKPAFRWECWQNHRPDWSELEVCWRGAIQRFGQNLNIATILGEAHGLCAIDVDEPEKFRLARQQVGLTENDLRTWVTKSHRGGALIFRYPQGVKIPSKVSNQNWGAELLGNERILVLPPSIHPSGTRYRWVFAPHKAPLKNIPPILLEVFSVEKKTNTQTVKPENHNANGFPEWAKVLISLLRPYWVEGCRHDLALALSGVLARRGIDKPLAEKILLTLVNECADTELKDRVRALLDTYDRLAENESVLAWSGLERILDEPTLRALDSLLPRNGTTVVVTHELIKRPSNPCTDLGNAERLVRLFGDRIRFVPSWGWMVFDGKRWVRDVNNQRITELAEETVRHIYNEAAQATDPETRKHLARWAVASESKQRIAAMVDLAAPMVLANVEDFDRHEWKLNLLNGTLDLLTGNFYPHTPSDYITKLAPVNYDPQAQCPRWITFLRRIFNENDNLIRFVQRAIGYSLTGDTREQVLFFCHGIGANGKSTMLDVIRALLGDYAAVADFTTFTSEHKSGARNDIARLYSVRLVVAIETGEEKRLAEPLVKAITGGDTIAARFLYREFFEFKPQFKLWLAANYKPEIRGADHAIWRRILLIPFSVVIPEHERVPNLADILKEELPGILNWALAGLRDWLSKGLCPPVEVREATLAYKEEMDVVGNFINDQCIIDPAAITPSKQLYDAFKAWAEENGAPVLSPQQFGRRLSTKGFERVQTGSQRQRCWRGLRLRSPDDHDSPPVLPEGRDTPEPIEPMNRFSPNFAHNKTHDQSFENIGSIGSSVRDQKISDPPKSDTDLSQSCNEVDTEAWLSNEVGFTDTPPSTDHRPNTDSHPPSGDKPPPTPQPSANPPPKPLKSHKNLSSPKELRPEELESEERFACPNCGNWLRVPVSTVMLVGPPRCPVCGSTMNPAQEPPPIVGGDRK